MQHLNKTVFHLVAAVAMAGVLTLMGCGGGDDDNTNPASPANVNNQQFTFTDGAVIDPRLVGKVTTLAFTNSASRATITSGANQAVGSNTFGSCVIGITASNFAVTAGPQVGNTINLTTCEVNTDTNTLNVVNGATGNVGSSNPGTATGTTGG